MYTSVTTLNEYIECKKKVQFKLSKEPMEATASLELGKAVHEAVDSIESSIKSSGSMDLDQIGELRKELLEYIAVPGRVIFYGGQSVRSVAGVFDRSISNYLELQKSAPELVSVEEEFKVRYKDIDIVGRYDQIRVSDDTSYIVELKTSKTFPDLAYLEHDLQLAIYTWAFDEMHGTLPNILYWNLPERRTASLVAYDGVKDALKIVDDFVRSYENGDFYREPNSFKCGRCPYRRKCLGEAQGRSSRIIY